MAHNTLSSLVRWGCPLASTLWAWPFPLLAHGLSGSTASHWLLPFTGVCGCGTTLAAMIVYALDKPPGCLLPSLGPLGCEHRWVSHSARFLGASFLSIQLGVSASHHTGRSPLGGCCIAHCDHRGRSKFQPCALVVGRFREEIHCCEEHTGFAAGITVEHWDWLCDRPEEGPATPMGSESPQACQLGDWRASPGSTVRRRDRLMGGPTGGKPPVVVPLGERRCSTLELGHCEVVVHPVPANWGLIVYALHWIGVLATTSPASIVLFLCIEPFG